MEPIKTRYANKMVDGRYYQTIKVAGNAKPKELTEEEFKAGEQGIVFIDNKTGKIVFDD